MSQFVDIIDVGKEKSVSKDKAVEMLQSFISANSGNENDTFDDTKIVGVKKWVRIVVGRCGGGTVEPSVVSHSQPVKRSNSV